MSDTNTKYNPSADQVSKPSLKQGAGNWTDDSRDHIKSGPQKNPKPAKG